MLTRRVTFRLYPTKTQAAKLFEWRKLHQLLYNSAVADRKESYQRLGQSVDYFDQQNALPAFKKVWPEYIELGSHALQATLKRVDFAFQRFFKGLGKYPRFKSIRHFSGWTYPDRAGWKAHTVGDNGTLELSNLARKLKEMCWGKLPPATFRAGGSFPRQTCSSIKMRGKARQWGTPTTCTILDRHRCWYASITINCEPVRETGDGAVGIDLGCLTAVAMSDGTKVENPRHLARTLRKIRSRSKQKRHRRAPNRKKGIKLNPLEEGTSESL